MLSIGALTTSQVEALATRLKEGDGLTEFLAAVSRFLSNTPADDGADSDHLYVRAVILDDEGIWDSVPAVRLAATLRKAPQKAVKQFLSGVNRPYREAVLGVLEGNRPKKKPPTKAQKGRLISRLRQNRPSVKYTIFLENLTIGTVTIEPLDVTALGMRASIAGLHAATTRIFPVADVTNTFIARKGPRKGILKQTRILAGDLRPKEQDERKRRDEQREP